MLNRKESTHRALEYELKREQAAALGRAGERVQVALQQLRAAQPDDSARMLQLRYAAAHAVHRYFIQREAMGMREHDTAVDEYGIPQNVLNLVGARQP